jgi:hypothetical protein
MSVKEIKESTDTWKILDDVLKKIKKLSPGKVPSLPEMERLLKELRKGKRKGGLVSRKDGGGIGVTKKDVKAAARRRKRTPAMGVTPKDVKRMRMPRKKSPPLGVTPKDVKRMKSRRAAHKIADVEKGVTKDVKRGERITRAVELVAETGGLRGKILRSVLGLDTGVAKLTGDTTGSEAIKRGKWRAAKKREEARTATDRSGKEHMDPYGLIRKTITGANRKGGIVKRKSGGKVMQGYKAGGKV